MSHDGLEPNSKYGYPLHQQKQQPECLVIVLSVDRLDGEHAFPFGMMVLEGVLSHTMTPFWPRSSSNSGCATDSSSEGDSLVVSLLLFRNRKKMINLSALHSLRARFRVLESESLRSTEMMISEGSPSRRRIVVEFLVDDRFSLMEGVEAKVESSQSSWMY
mmetsp:Transcript_62068/g.93701  ORF Transcript_62068/g.93701 Transcript_62068/m.93701 type:complete len:161 (+) Transcript_62068:276-758(+)